MATIRNHSGTVCQWCRGEGRGREKMRGLVRTHAVMREANVLGMLSQPILPPAQVPVTNREAPLNFQFVACYTLKRIQANPLYIYIHPPRKLIL